MKPIYLALLLVLAPALAGAQVVIHQDALDQLAGVVPRVAAMPVSAEVVHPAARVIHEPVKQKLVTPKLLAVVAKPAPVSVPVPAPAAPVAPEPPVLAPLAPVSVSFASGSADLPAGAAAALKPVCERAGVGGLVSVDAYAAADSSDLSAPMRLSLSRAMAVRDALVACGVVPSNIIPRADGAVAGQGPDAAVIKLGTGAAK
ncbi:MAG: hypothetical protein POG74_04490 [Acidocella sp.]|nr:hypothetical protein [Acidocella sp.]